MLLSLAANFDWPLQQFDVKNSFLHGELSEKVYMDYPPGYEIPRLHDYRICRLKKSLYGLKQSPRVWFGKFTKSMKAFGYTQRNTYHTLFLKRQQGKIIALIVYVDDLVVTGIDPEERKALQSYLSKEFKLKDLGPIKFFLEIEVSRSSKGIFLSQKKYTLDLLKETSMTACQPADTPVEKGLNLIVEPNQIPVDKGRYQRLVGRLMYLAHTRPDRAYSLSVAARDIAHNPVQHDRTKHVEVDRFFIKDGKILELPKIRLEDQLADLLTKAASNSCCQSFNIMPQNEKKQLVPLPDVLSNLPDSVIDDILMSLPLRDAVRTSILSKKWRYNWCKLPQLKLDQTLWETAEDLISPTIGFTNILCHFLTLHTGPITKFILDIPDLETCPNIDHLIYFLSRNGIQHLVLKPPLSSKPYKLPSSFFTCSQLRHLFLRECLIRPPPVFKGFDKLTSLELIEVKISSALLGSLISHCPLLEHLVLQHDAITDHIEISSPKLRSFIFTGSIKFLHLKNAPLLSKVSYEPTEFRVKAEHDVCKIFESIPALENLCWINDCVQDVRVGPAEVIPTRLPYALHCLKRLYISGITLGEFFDVSFALCLIRSSPNLEEIEIEMYVVSDEDYFVHVPREAVDEIHASFSDMTFNHLRTIKLSNVAGAGAEMQLIKVLLAKSPALVKMVIDPYRMKAEKSLKVLAEITNFQRVSSKAQVGYNVD
ncbi:F-box/FBD/LRR-repeat protein At1g13570-like [Solanum stenotomum]|uniref:F-box/FBD/LRR-repeat protein At1g13570-like n=1 Tax=Solanum stenotomum TaxID=172797 RepID=UPI0020D026BD|nr:F-box/FBD/LRR-repeat protein At1g13570-like [Solanum stenotomum]